MSELLLDNPASLCGRVVRLSALTPDLYGELADIETALSMHGRWRLRGMNYSPQRYAESLWSGVLVQFALVTRRSGSLIGLTTAYDYRRSSGTVAVAVLVTPGYPGSAFDGLALLVRHLFDRWPIRKIYFEILEENLGMFDRHVERFCVKEACFVLDDYRLGSYQSQTIVSIDRSAWESEIEPWIEPWFDPARRPERPG